MTQEALLITGYPIKLENFSDYDAIETALAQHFVEHYHCDGYTPTVSEPMLICVRRDYDSNSADDYGMYIAFNIQKLANGEKVNIVPKEEIAIPPELLSMIEECGFKVSMDFGTYSDICDCDRCWYVYTDKTKVPVAQPASGRREISVIPKGDNLFMEEGHSFAIRRIEDNLAVIGKYVDDNIVPLSEEEQLVAISMGIALVV